MSDARIEYLKNELKDFNKSSIDGFVRMLDLIIKEEKEINKNMKEFTKKDYINLLKKMNSKSGLSILNYTYRINIILEKFNIDLRIDGINDIEKDELIDPEALSRLYTKEEIIEICDTLVNPCDKFIIYALFNGIQGKQLKDLRELKTENIDLNKKKIYVLGKTIKMDEYMFDICSDMIEADEYYKYNYDGKQSSYTYDSYKLNMESVYAIKPRPTSANNDGLNPIQVNGVKTKLFKLSKQIGMVINSTNIVKSGVLHKIHEESKERGENVTTSFVERFLEDNKMNKTVYETYRLYNLKYKK